VTVTTLNIWDIVACLRLKVWDPEANKMIGKKELREDNRLRQSVATGLKS